MTTSEAIDLAQAVAWPLVILVALIVYRRSIRRLLASLGDRASGFTAGPLSVTFTVATEPSAEVTDALTNITNPTTSAMTSSDARAALSRLLSGPRVESFHVDLGDGKSWLTSRLFLYSRVLPEAIGIRCLVFTETRSGLRNSFVGIAEPRAVAETLASRYDWFGQAFDSGVKEIPSWSQESLTEEVRAAVEKAASIEGEDDEDDEDDQDDQDLSSAIASAARHSVQLARLDNSYAAAGVAESFLASPLIHAEPGPVPDPHDEWVLVEPKNRSAYQEHAEWISDGGHLGAILGPALKEDGALEESPTEKRSELGRRVVAADGEFVAIINSRDRYLRLLSRASGLEQVARDAARQD